MRRFRLALALVCGAAVTAGVVAAWDSPVLDLRTVEVGGNHRVEARDVVVASTLTRRDHLLRISPARVASHVETSPWVAEARVERILPSRVRITVVERTPAAVVTTGTWSYLADARGVVLEQVPSGAAPPEVRGVRMPVVADLPVKALVPGGHIRLAQYRESLAVLRSLPPAVARHVTVIRAPSEEGLTIELSDGLVIFYGAAEAMGDKAFALQALLERAADTQIAVASIDVRVPSRPALRPR